MSPKSPGTVNASNAIIALRASISAAADDDRLMRVIPENNLDSLIHRFIDSLRFI